MPRLSPDKSKPLDEERGPEGSIKIEKKVEAAARGKCVLVKREVSFPGFVPEVKGPEDWRAVIRSNQADSPKWPIILPSGHWEALMRSIPEILRVYEPSLAQLIQSRHFIFYDPPELFRFVMPLTLISFGLRASVSQARRFWTLAIEEDDKESALGMLPEFERKFVEPQWDLALWQKYKQPRIKEWPSVKKPAKPESTPRVDGVWDSIDQEYFSKVQEAMDEASILPSASFIPLVPVLKASSSEQRRAQVRQMNRAAAYLSRQRYKLVNWSGGQTNVAWPWLSLYIDPSCCDAGSDDKAATGVEKISELAKASFDSKAHVGIALTVYSLGSAKKDSTRKERLIWLVEDLDEFASSRGVPILLPRSGYPGLELLDYGVRFFSSLLSGAATYPHSRGMSDREEDQYGKTAVYRVGDLSFEELKDYLTANKELPPVRGVPSRPTDLMMKDPPTFRAEFSKPARLGTHARELDEISKAIDKGTRRPALRYLEDMASAGGKSYL